MAQYTRIEVFTTMKETGMVPLFYNGDLAVCKELITACYKGGARLMEFTARGDFAHEIFGALNQFALKELPGLILGVGSITDAAAASLYMQMGANFIVTPSLREDIAVVCNRRKVLWSPGCGSLTEINKAEELGCELVKLFPGATYGAGFVKAIKGPQPWTNIMPTGGVDLNEDNLRAWFDAGVTCVGLGSKLIDKTTITNRDYTGLEKKVHDTMALIRKIRTV
ncbi:bifunctional 4-hydroxy-2-oxoglutarate aldolase/2-dehydro-3-deoxy-phosphogluconate aldolase [Flavobacteriaceae bacterium F08102]|nr:bifunctional 4-hydroxy-2-oxoglutarate aldolase/2-dehydro-3-deoxy-phosphogluconate aldolase [Flavobacteriaceae bacterium F08102]